MGVGQLNSGIKLKNQAYRLSNSNSNCVYCNNNKNMKFNISELTLTFILAKDPDEASL